MATETQRFQVGDRVRVQKHVHADIARHADKEGVIESVITPENDHKYYYVRSGGVVLDKFFYADELVSCAPAPADDREQLRAENERLRAALQRIVDMKRLIDTGESYPVWVDSLQQYADDMKTIAADALKNATSSATDA